jgi:hypothetical protein
MDGLGVERAALLMCGCTAVPNFGEGTGKRVQVQVLFVAIFIVYRRTAIGLCWRSSPPRADVGRTCSSCCEWAWIASLRRLKIAPGTGTGSLPG